MGTDARELISKEYGLELIGCLLNEIGKLPGFDRLAVVKHAHELLSKECKNEAETILSGNTGGEYTELKNKLAVMLTEKKEQLIELVEINNIPSLINGK